MAGIATNPVEGRWGGAIWGGDVAGGVGPGDAGVWGGNPTIYVNVIPLPDQMARRTQLTQAPEMVLQDARRTQNGRAVRVP